MELRCSTDFYMRKCNKFLGWYEVLVGKVYCKSCGQSNYYEIPPTEKGLQKLKEL